MGRHEDDIFQMIGELGLDYVKRRLQGQKPKLRVYLGFEDDPAYDPNEEGPCVPDERAGAAHGPRKAQTADGVRRKAVRE